MYSVKHFVGASKLTKNISLLSCSYELHFRRLFYFNMIINKNYIQGILDATFEVYEIENGRIERDKDLRFTLIEKQNYIEVKFTCKIELSSKWKVDHTYHENSINIYEADTLSGFIADIQSELTEIHLKTINYI